MTTAAIRQRLITYVSDASAEKVKEIFAILEKEMESIQDFSLSNDQMEILETEGIKHAQGLSKSYSRKETIQIIKGEKTL